MKTEPSQKRPRAETSEGAAGQPVLRSSLERFVYAAGRTDGGVTAHVGLPVMLEGFHVLGLAASCQRFLRLKARRRGPSRPHGPHAPSRAARHGLPPPGLAAPGHHPAPPGH